MIANMLFKESANMSKNIPKVTPLKHRKPTTQKTHNSKNKAHVYQIKITLIDTEPEIWRRIVVSGNTNLGLLHAIIQIAMGWTNSHLHQFIADNTFYSDPDLDNEMEDMEDEYKMLLCEIAPKVGESFMYEYDFGDGWNHLIEVEKIINEGIAHPICLDGARACPPEDCGGTGGYQDLCEIIQDPEHEEYESMLEWLNGGFDPDAFDVQKVNKYLKKLKWEKPNWKQLGKLLMERDEMD